VDLGNLDRGVLHSRTLAILALLPPDRVSILTGLVQTAAAAGTRLGIAWPLPVLAFAICFRRPGTTRSVDRWKRAPAVRDRIDRYLPPLFARLHPRWRTPHVSILILSTACTFFLIVMQFGESLRIGYQLLVDMTVITYFIPFCTCSARPANMGRR